MRTPTQITIGIPPESKDFIDYLARENGATIETDGPHKGEYRYTNEIVSQIGKDILLLAGKSLILEEKNITLKLKNKDKTKVQAAKKMLSKKKATKASEVKK